MGRGVAVLREATDRLRRRALGGLALVRELLQAARDAQGLLASRSPRSHRSSAAGLCVLVLSEADSHWRRAVAAKLAAVKELRQGRDRLHGLGPHQRAAELAGPSARLDAHALH